MCYWRVIYNTFLFRWELHFWFLFIFFFVFINIRNSTLSWFSLFNHDYFLFFFFFLVAFFFNLSFGFRFHFTFSPGLLPSRFGFWGLYRVWLRLWLWLWIWLGLLILFFLFIFRPLIKPSISLNEAPSGSLLNQAVFLVIILFAVFLVGHHFLYNKKNYGYRALKHQIKNKITH
jgi:hypothetical protein